MLEIIVRYLTCCYHNDVDLRRMISRFAVKVYGVCLNINVFVFL